ncbi:hypothetical protein, partial [Rhodovulum euryhalinum]|uniref:hypothetical protein n=1 Tax=Rhodovulum euryhalinum TaxID=35805 RepID=UPI001A9F841A
MSLTSGRTLREVPAAKRWIDRQSSSTAKICASACCALRASNLGDVLERVDQQVATGAVPASRAARRPRGTHLRRGVSEVLPLGVVVDGGLFPGRDGGFGLGLPGA